MATDSLHITPPNPEHHAGHHAADHANGAFPFHGQSFEFFDAFQQHAAAARNHERHADRRPWRRAKDSPISTRHATLPTGSITVQSQE